MNRVKTYFDHETRKVIRASNKIIRLCRFKQDNNILGEGLRSILKELNGEKSKAGITGNQDKSCGSMASQNDSRPFNQKGDI